MDSILKKKFKIFDSDAMFVFSDKELMENVMKITAPDLKISSSDIKLVENLDEFNKA